jgi:release factor glutamine methyltransferase
MKTVKDVFAAFKSGLLYLYNSNEIEAIIMLSISEITGLSKAKIKAFPETELSNEQSLALTGIILQLKTGKPIHFRQNRILRPAFFCKPFGTDSKARN